MIPPASEINTYSELVAAETAFREVVRSAIGPNWTGDFAPEKIASLEARRTEEDKKRDGVAVSQDLLDYAEAYDLESLILKNWDKSGPILKDKKRAEVFLNLLLDVRNAIAHSRPVAPFERHLLAGIAGQVQNLISIHRGRSETADAYYASINYIRDSFGDEVTGIEARRGNPDDAVSQVARKRLKVGQVIVFECSATDPYDRNIVWRFVLHSKDSGHQTRMLGQAYGATATFQWIVQPEHYGERRIVVIAMSNDSPYKRDGSSDDDCAVFFYDVSPPVPLQPR